MLPASIRSGRESPRFMYRLAIDTTSRRFARIMCSRDAPQFSLMILRHSAFSCSAVSSLISSICLRYSSRSVFTRELFAMGDGLLLGVVARPAGEFVVQLSRAIKAAGPAGAAGERPRRNRSANRPRRQGQPAWNRTARDAPRARQRGQKGHKKSPPTWRRRRAVGSDSGAALLDSSVKLPNAARSCIQDNNNSQTLDHLAFGWANSAVTDLAGIATNRRLPPRDPAAEVF